MALIPEIGIAVLIVIITLWLESVGLAALIHWVRNAFASDARKLGLFRSAVLVVRLSAAVIVLHAVLILFWASCYPGFASRPGGPPFTSRPAAMPPRVMAT